MPDVPLSLRSLSLRLTLMVILSASIFASFSTWGRAQDHEQERETSHLLAILFDSGRIVVGMNQALNRHLEGANYAFVDGHVKWLKKTNLSNDAPSGSRATFLLK